MRYVGPAVLGSLFAVSTAQAHEGDVPTARATWTDRPPTIDGLLDDAQWQNAIAYDNFIERKPHLRGTPPNQTTFRVLLDAEAIYIAIDCRDLQPETVRARTLNRDDFGIFSDDAISVKLDTGHDHRTTYGFAINAGGGKLDYRGVNESDFRVEFDAVWQGAAVRTSDGWSAEFGLPLSEIGIDPADPPARIGLNLSRDHSSSNATYDWALMPPPFSPVAASIYGHLDGLDELRNHDVGSTNEYALIPYALGGYRRDLNDDGRLDDEALFSGGFDATARLGGNWGAHLTFNTDFAQVDLDNQVVNLSRFGLFLPEKRDFFLSDVDLFSFGLGGESQPFYSRRIGLQSGEEVPILTGAKVVGGGSTRIGVLHVATRPQDEVPWTSNLIARGQTDLGDSGSNVGLLFAHRQSLELEDDRNVVIGVDGAWRGREVPLLISTFAMGSVTGPAASAGQIATGGEGTGTFADRVAPGAGVNVSLRDELVRPAMYYAYYHPELRADLGFLRRVGIHKAGLSVDVEPRIGAGGIEKVAGGGFGSVTASALADGILEWFLGYYGAVTSDTGYYGRAELRYGRESVTEPFEVGRDTVIPVDDYTNWSVALSGYTPSTYAIHANGLFVAQRYYDSLRLRGGGGVQLVPTDLFRLEVGAEYNHVDFDSLLQNDFGSFVLNGRTTFGFTTTLGLDVYGGYNLLGDLLQIQSRLRWIYAPGSDLFIVYQLNLDDDDWSTRFTSMIVKTSYRFDL